VEKSTDIGDSLDGVVPVWARPDAFPEKKATSSPFGYIDLKGGSHSAENAEDLAQQIKTSRLGVDLVWSPESDRLLVPEALPSLRGALRERQLRFVAQDLSDGKRMSFVFGAVFLWTVWAAWNNGGRKIEALYSSQLTGLAALLLLLLGLVPLYEAWKLHRAITSPEAGREEDVQDAQFDSWLHRQKIPATYGLLGLILLCALVQVSVDWGKLEFTQSILRAGLLKRQALQHPEIQDASAWWRMFTAPFLHGNIIHFLMNASGILYLGRRTESLARWPHLLIVFFVGMWVGGVASFYVYPEKIAVGASGGLMGLLGFMLAFETLHKRLVPRPARRRLLAGVVLMGVMGFLGMSFIDNAAHAGGLLAGVVYAWIVFPSSESSRRPETMKRDKLVGALVGLLLVLFAFSACYQMLVG